jgi:hypothetical protein
MSESEGTKEPILDAEGDTFDLNGVIIISFRHQVV